MVFNKEELHILSNRDNINLISQIKQLNKNIDEHLPRIKLISFDIINDNSVNENLEKLIEVISKDKNKKIGEFSKDEYKSSFIVDFRNRLKKLDYDLTDISGSFAYIMAIKEDNEIEIIKKACKVSVAIFDNYVNRELRNIINSKKEIKHTKFSEKIEKTIEYKKYRKNLDPSLLEMCYIPIVQSGGNYDLKFSAQNDANNIHCDAIICSFGTRYKNYCSNIARTILVSPTEEQKKIYEFLLQVERKALEKLVDGARICDVYKSVINFVKEKDESLFKNLKKDLGFAIGIKFRSASLALNPKNKRILKKGMVFSLSIGFSQLIKKQTTHENSSKYALFISDTVLINDSNTPAELLTLCEKKFTNIAIFLNDEKIEQERETENVASECTRVLRRRVSSKPVNQLIKRYGTGSFTQVFRKNIDKPCKICDRFFVDGEFRIICDVCKFWYHGSCENVSESKAAEIGKYHCKSCSPCRICYRFYVKGKFWIKCDVCKFWYHGQCEKIHVDDTNEIEEYHCKSCSPHHGPSKYNIQNNHRYDRTYNNKNQPLPTQIGTAKFIEELKQNRKLKKLDKVYKINGYQVTMDFLVENGFDRPILVEDAEGLEMELPKEFNLDVLLNKLCSNYPIAVINVHKQKGYEMQLGDLVAEFKNKDRDDKSKILNCLSLELSSTKLSDEIKSPNIVRNNLSWADNVYENDDDKPAVQKYVLLSMKDSFTNFHIDFGGSSVWYHIYSGSKIFYFIEPTETNIKAYEEWLTKKNHSEIFFPDEIKDKCYFYELKQGDTMIMPAGWIHAVYTPDDSIAFGGNFLNIFRADLQIKVFELDDRVKLNKKFKFPKFKFTHCVAAEFVYQSLKNLIKDNKLNKELCTNDPRCKKLYDSFSSYLNFTLKHIEELKEIPSKKRNGEQQMLVENSSKYNESLVLIDGLLETIKPHDENNLDDNEQVILQSNKEQINNETNDEKMNEAKLQVIKQPDMQFNSTTDNESNQNLNLIYKLDQEISTTKKSSNDLKETDDDNDGKSSKICEELYVKTIKPYDNNELEDGGEVGTLNQNCSLELIDNKEININEQVILQSNKEQINNETNDEKMNEAKLQVIKQPDMQVNSNKEEKDKNVISYKNSNNKRKKSNKELNNNKELDYGIETSNCKKQKTSNKEHGEQEVNTTYDNKMQIDDSYSTPLSERITSTDPTTVEKIPSSSNMLNEQKVLLPVDKIKQFTTNEPLPIKSLDQNEKQNIIETIPQLEVEIRNIKKEKISYPISRGYKISLNKSDLNCLQNGEYINDEIVDFYSMYIKSNLLYPNIRDKTYIFSSFFFTKLISFKQRVSDEKEFLKKQYDHVKNWTNNIDIFQFDYLVIPICSNKHWSLALICFARKLLGNNNGNKSNQGLDKADYRPCIIYMDSMYNSNLSDKYVKFLRNFLTNECANKKNLTIEFNDCEMQTLKPEVPKQTNDYDCGIFLINYIEKFLNDPDATIYKIKNKNNLKYWFDPTLIEKVKRKDIFELLKKLFYNHELDQIDDIYDNNESHEIIEIENTEKRRWFGSFERYNSSSSESEYDETFNRNRRMKQYLDNAEKCQEIRIQQDEELNELDNHELDEIDDIYDNEQVILQPKKEQINNETNDEKMNEAKLQVIKQPDMQVNSNKEEMDKNVISYKNSNNKRKKSKKEPPNNKERVYRIETRNRKKQKTSNKEHGQQEVNKENDNEMQIDDSNEIEEIVGKDLLNEEKKDNQFLEDDVELTQGGYFISKLKGNKLQRMPENSHIDDWLIKRYKLLKEKPTQENLIKKDDVKNSFFRFFYNFFKDKKELPDPKSIIGTRMYQIFKGVGETQLGLGREYIKSYSSRPRCYTLLGIKDNRY